MIGTDVSSLAGSSSEAYSNQTHLRNKGGKTVKSGQMSNEKKRKKLEKTRRGEMKGKRE